MIRERTVGKLDSWISSCSSSGIEGFETFAAGLRQDYTAVRAALTEPWSNGQSEGQINRLKTIEWEMYGRASFNLLRNRVIYRAA
ncbi:transposase [Salinibacter ruber]|nr:transposase [Salinibacter ruber]